MRAGFRLKPVTKIVVVSHAAPARRFRHSTERPTMHISKNALALAVAAVVSSLATAGSADRPNPSFANAKSGKTPHGPAQFKYPRRTSATANTVLYDQSGTADGMAPAQNYPPPNDAYDSEAADDFVVTAPSGWTVTAFNFQVGFNGAVPPGSTYDINIYDDANGQPGAIVCENPARPGALDASQSNLSVSLSSPCPLSAGRYWISLSGNIDQPTRMSWMAGTELPIDNMATWRQPLDGDLTGCTDWSPMLGCSSGAMWIGSGDFNLLFQVVGGVGIDACNPSGICLVSTVGTDLTPGACGAVQTIDATVGDQLNFCYTITNNTGIDLNYHTLANNVDGVLLDFMQQTVPAGGTFQHNEIKTVGNTLTYNAAWTAYDALPAYVATAEGGGSCGDRIFADDFENTTPSCAGDTFVDITATGTSLGLGDEDTIDLMMPFSFDFYGATSNALTVSNNGGAIFGAPGAYLDFANTSLPAASLPGPGLFPLWDDFDSESGDVYTDVRGSAPNRQFIVEWFNRMHYSANTDGATFELILGEDGTIRFEYADVGYTNNTSPSDPPDCTGGACATIGLQGSTVLFDEFSAFEAAVADHSSIKWSPAVPQVFTSTDSVTVNVGAPQIVVNPGSITGFVATGGTTTLPFAIENHGNRDLDWNVDEAPSGQHVPPKWQPRYVVPAPHAAERALTMTKAAPRAGRGKLKPHTHAPLAVVPAFIMDHGAGGDQFGTIDAASPQTFDTIAAAPAALYKTGTFVDNDFSKEYAASIDTNEIGTIDTTTGVVTVLPASSPPTVGGEIWVGLKWDATTSTLFGAACDGTGAGCHLYTIDPATGSVAQGPAITNIDSGSGAFLIDIAIDPNGLMYGVEYFSGALVAIDKSTGEGGIIGTTGVAPAYVQALDFDASTGTLYWASYDITATGTMYTIDTTTGAVNLVGPLANVDEQYALAIAVSSTPCAQPQDLPWLSLAPVSGSTPGNAASPATATIDATGHVDGDVLDGSICVHSNDPAKPLVTTPISVTVGSAPPIAPTVTKAFAPSAIPSGGTSTLTITLANANPTAATLTAPLVDAFPDALVVAASPNASTTCGGNVSAAPGTGSVTLDSAGAAIPAGGACTIVVDVTAPTGQYANDIPAGALQTSAGASTAPADATLEASDPPTLSKTFAPALVAPGLPTTLTITLSNSASVGADLTAALIDAFPAGLSVAAIPNAVSDCGGQVTITAAPVGVTLDAAGSTIPASGSCTLQIDVVSGGVGTFVNTLDAGALQTSIGSNTAQASATLRSAVPPTITKAFTPQTVAADTPSTLHIDIVNINPGSTTLLADLTDAFPTGLVVASPANLATTCAGTATATSGADSVTLAAGAIVPSGGCGIDVDVVSSVAGDYANDIPQGALQTDAGSNPQPADATLTVQ
jgi:hypothetical protein